MLVEEIAIPHQAGPITIRLHERVTVFAGLDVSARARLVDLLVTGLAGEGPASVAVRTDDGRADRIEPGSAPSDDATATGTLRRLMVVARKDLGLELPPAEAGLAAERTAASIAHRELTREVHALDAGAAERARLERELGSAPSRPGPPPGDPGADGPGGDGPTDDGLEELARSAPRVDDLLRRRQDADDALHEARSALRAYGDDAPLLAAVAPAPAPGVLGTALRAAVEARHRAGSGDDPAAVEDAEAGVARATADLRAMEQAAVDEIDDCDRQLGEIADAVGVEVGVTGPGASLTAALARRRARWARTEDTDPAARLLARRRAAITARISELPDEQDVLDARRRLDEVVARLQSLGGPRGYDIAQVRQTLIGRAAALRPEGVVPVAPLVLDEALLGLPTDHLCDLLDLVLRISERAQVVLLTGDPTQAAWARDRAHTPHLRLIELTPPR